MVATLFTVTIIMAQAPQAIAYQAAARNGKGVVLAFKTVGLRFTVLDTVAGARRTIYQETMPAATNALGLFMVNIGQGSPVKGTFSSINWGATAGMYIQVELDTTGYHGNDPNSSIYVVIGTQQLTSAPYALYANYATNAGTATIAYNGVPTGTIIAYGANLDAGAPDGWELCDGRAVTTTDPKYANLFKVIRFSWGKDPGNGTFYLPFTNGMFLRGRQNGWPTNYDPDASSRIYFDGTPYGDNVGSYQADVFQNHTHTLGGAHSQGITAGGGGNGPFLQYDGRGSVQVNGVDNGYKYGSETRPKNVSVQYIIKL